MLEENQDLREEETLNLTGKELEEYKTYLKFKNEIEKQNESQKGVQLKKQNVTQNQSQVNKPNVGSTIKSVQSETGTTNTKNLKHTLSEDPISKTGYKEYFMEPIDTKPIEKYRNALIRDIRIKIFALCWLSFSWRNWNGSLIILKIFIFVIIMRNIMDVAKQLFVTETTNTLKAKVKRYNTLIRDVEWVKLSNDNENFTKYANIAKYTIKSKLRLIAGRPQFRHDKYTEVYHILNSNIYVVYGIYDSIGFKSTRALGYMIVIENKECVLNLIAGDVMREKLTILDDL